MSDELDTVTKLGGGALGGAGIVGLLLKLLFGGVQRELAELRSEVAKLRERTDGISSAYRPELQGLQVRVGRLEGRSGLIGEGSTKGDS